MNKRIAIIRIHGNTKLNDRIKDTLNLMRLYRKHTCIIVPNTPSVTGMLKKIKDFVTWGEINQETFSKVLKERGRLPGKKRLTEKYLKEKLNMDFKKFVEEFFAFKKELRDIPGLKPFFKLSPPVKGYERKGTKKPFSMGGVLGYRKEKINELIERML